MRNGRGHRGRFICNFSEYLESNEEIQELLECYKVADCVDDALCERYGKKTDKGGDSSTPGLVRLHIPTIAKLPATFVPSIMKIGMSKIDNIPYRLSSIIPLGLSIIIDYNRYFFYSN